MPNRQWLVALSCASLLWSGSAYAQESPAWVVNGVQRVQLAPVAYGHGDCNCSACQKEYGAAQDSAAAPEAMPADEPAVAAPELMDDANLLASNFGGTQGALSSRYGIIGDFFGGAYQMTLNDLTGSFGTVESANIPIAAADRRFKMADGNSPFPVDRFFFNYNHFHNALTTVDGRETDLNRYIVGAELATDSQLASFEFRLPFAAGLDNVQVFDPSADNTATEFGNIGMALKRLIYESQTVRGSVGLGMVLPTAADALVVDSFGADYLTIGNEAFYLQPFTGWLWTPNDRFFTQFFAQMDFDCNGNPVTYERTGATGVIQDQTLLFLDASFGYWLYHDPCGCRLITGLAPMVELHYTTTVEDSDIVTFQDINAGGNTITNPNGRQDVLNLTGGLRFEVRGDSFLNAAVVVPLRDNGDHIFDAELAMQYVRFF